MNQIAQQTIDDLVLNPLRSFFRQDNINPKNLRKFIKDRGIPHTKRQNQRREQHHEFWLGFVLESYVKLTLHRFYESTLIPLLPADFTNKFVDTRYLFDRNKYGNFRVFDMWRPAYQLIVAELDGIYEYNSTPFIVEISMSKNGKTNREFKKELVRKAYGVNPYFLRFIATDEYPRHKTGYIPFRYKRDFEEITEKIRIKKL